VVSDLRPPPALRLRPAAKRFPLRCCNSRMPAWIVVRDKPVAWATSDIPPRGKEFASAAAHIRRPRSFRSSRSARYFFCKTANSVPMKQEYADLLNCSSYLCAAAKVQSESSGHSILNAGYLRQYALRQ
jgi:hypothetical protein